jgi:hypothetical protein
LIPVTDTQRLLAWQAVAGQRGSLAEMRTLQRLLDALALDDDTERQQIAQKRMMHAVQPVAASLADPDTAAYGIDVTEDQAQKLARLLAAWQQWTAPDAQPVRCLIAALGGEPPSVLRRGRTDYAVLLSAGARLQAGFFAKQIPGTLAEAAQWAAIAEAVMLDDAEAASVKFRAFTNGQAGWSAAAAAALEPRMAELARPEAEMLLKRIESHEGWTPADARWVDEVTGQLKDERTLSNAGSN